MVCPEYLDVINVVVRDAYTSTYPRAISAVGYINSIERHGAQPSYDEAWRQRVMERAFKRMVHKDKILTCKQMQWELHPDFEAKRFFKVRDSAEWVSQIYSPYISDQHQSRVALQSLESFLNCDLGPISGKQLIKFFGPSAGEEYDALQIEYNKIIKPEPVSESVDLNCTSSMATTRRERVEIEIDDDDEHNSSGSEASSPILLFTPMSSPPSLQSAPSSFETDTNVPSGTSNTVVEKPREAAAATRSDIMIMEKSGQEVRVEAQPEIATIETPKQESQRGTHSVTTVGKPGQETSSAVQTQRAAIEKPGQHTFGIAQSVLPAQAAPASSVSNVVDLNSLISRYPWVLGAAKRTQERFPLDSFELVASEGTLKFKCHDCPLNLYKAIYPDKNISNFEAHLRSLSHRGKVAARLGDVPAVSKSSKSRVSGVAAQSSQAGRRESLNSRVSGEQASPAVHGPNTAPRINVRSSLVEQPSTEHDRDGDSDQENTAERQSLIVIFPVGPALNASNARKRARVSGPSESGYEALDNEDRAKRRRLDPTGYSTNPNTAKARARLANLDPRTKQYESMIANDRQSTKNHVEHVVKRSQAYQHASPRARFAMEEQGRNEHMDSRYDPQSNRGKGLLTHGRRKAGRDAESYARSQGGYNKFTKVWGYADENPTAPTRSMRNARYVDAATDSRDLAMEDSQDAMEAPIKAGSGTAFSSYQISQSEDATASKAEHSAHFGHQKYHSSDDEIESQTHTGRDLESEIKASESSSFNNMALGEKRASLSSLLSLLEKRGETQRENFTAAHHLQVSTSEEVGLLRSASYRHDQELDAIKHSMKREKEWRKYFDKSTKEDRTKFARLEAKVAREREDKQNFKMSMEGRVDATIKHHQTSTDAMLKRITALEKSMTDQQSDATSQRIATLESLMTDQNKQLNQTLSGSMFKKVAALEKLVTDQNRQNQQASLDAISKKVAALEKLLTDQSRQNEQTSLDAMSKKVAALEKLVTDQNRQNQQASSDAMSKKLAALEKLVTDPGRQNQQTSSDALSKKVAALEKLITDQSRHHQTLSGAMTRKMDAMEKLMTDQSKQLVEQSKVIEMLTKRALASPRELSQTPGMEPRPSKEKERGSLTTAGGKTPLRPAWAN